MTAIVVSALMAAAPAAALEAPLETHARLLDKRLAFSVADRPGPALLRSTEGYPHVIAYGSNGISLIVAGAILGVIATPFLGVGGYFLVRSINATGDALTTDVALGWSLGGVGAVFLAIGLPLLIVGIVRIARWGLAANKRRPEWLAFSAWGATGS